MQLIYTLIVPHSLHGGENAHHKPTIQIKIFGETPHAKHTHTHHKKPLNKNKKSDLTTHYPQ